jgi:hypothetical protein
MVVNACHGTRVECLHQQRAHAGDNHRDSPVDVPDGGARPKVAGVIAFSNFADPVWFTHRVAGEHGEKLGPILLAKRWHDTTLAERC